MLFVIVISSKMGRKSLANASPLSAKSSGVSKNKVKKSFSKIKTNKVQDNREKNINLDNKETLFGNIVEKIEEAIKSQKDYASKTTKNSLFPDIDNALGLTFTLKKLAPDHQSSTKYVNVPFPERSFENTSICLILPDIAKTKEVNTNTDTEIEAREWSEVLEEKFGIDKSFYSKIYTLRQLRREVKGYEAIQSFSRTYDVFMAASNVFKCTISHLGKNFLKSNKALYPLCLKSRPKEKIENVVKKVAVRINPSKLNMLTKIGNTSQKDTELLKNAEVILKTFLDNVPGGLENIRCIYLGNVGGVVSLPVYVSAGNPNSVEIPKPKTVVDTEAEVIDEVNTIEKDDVVVGVTKSGKINFRNATTKELLGKKRKKTTSEGEDLIPSKAPKKTNNVLSDENKDTIVAASGKVTEVKTVDNNGNEKSSKKREVLKSKKLINGNKSAPVKTTVPSSSVSNKDDLVVNNKKEKSEVEGKKTPKAKTLVEKKSPAATTIKNKTVNNKRELTPPTLRVSVRQKKKDVNLKTEKNNSKIDTPLKPVSKAPKVFVAEGSNEKSAAATKTKLTVKKKSNGSVKKNK